MYRYTYIINIPLFININHLSPGAAAGRAAGFGIN